MRISNNGDQLGYILQLINHTMNGNGGLGSPWQALVLITGACLAQSCHALEIRSTWFKLSLSVTSSYPPGACLWQSCCDENITWDLSFAHFGYSIISLKTTFLLGNSINLKKRQSYHLTQLTNILHSPYMLIAINLIHENNMNHMFHMLLCFYQISRICWPISCNRLWSKELNCLHFHFHLDIWSKKQI